MALLDYVQTRPVAFNTDPDSRTYERDTLVYQRQMNAFNMQVQAAQNELTQETTTKSALQKAAHDAIMDIARRLS